MGQQRVLRDHDRLGHAAVAENPEAAMAWFGAPLGVTAAAFRALSAVDGRLDFIGGVGPPTRARSTRLASRPLAAAGSAMAPTFTSIATVACASCASRSTC